MIYWAGIFFVIALVVGALGFLLGASVAVIAKSVFFVFLGLGVFSLMLAALQHRVV